MTTHDIPLTLEEAGSGRPVLVIHGGGGPATVAPIVAHLSETMHTICPTLPGWDGTERPEWLTGVDDLALGYLRHLRDRDLSDVLVVGSSIGGWIAAEMLVGDLAGRITGAVLLDAGGIEVEGQPMTDFFALDPRGIAEHAFHDPDRFFVDPATLPPAQQAVMKGNANSLRAIAQDPYMHDPKLRRRLAGVRTPTLVLWGDSDRMFTPEYGRAYAESFADGRFELVADAGHLPHLEQPEATFARIDAFAGTTR